MKGKTVHVGGVGGVPEGRRGQDKHGRQGKGAGQHLHRAAVADYVYLNPAKDGWERYQGVKGFFGFYNHEKRHQGIGKQIPVEVYEQQAA